ncbi:MAG: regulatory signaling modulator protein AmpE [Gammaproteobacteria bacterium]
MKLLALLLGLFIERVSTNLFGLREIRWLDRYFDRALALMGNGKGVRAYIVAVIAIALCALPVFAITYFIQAKFFGLFELAVSVIASVIVLFLALGPRDLSAEVDEFSAASARGDDEAMRRVAKELLEFDPPEKDDLLGGAVASAVFVQSTNRTFGVVLWFVLLGPLGAWVFRITDLMRRRAFYESDRREHEGKDELPFLRPVQNLHGILVWLPSRLAAMSFALAGSFEPATTAWKAYYSECSEEFFNVNDDVVASAGCGALGRQAQADMAESPGAGARCALSLVERSTIVWLVVISLLTIGGAAI